MIVLIAILLSALLGMAALAVDVSVAHLEDARLQNALDAGVLAGASALPDTLAAEALAREYIRRNGAENADVTISFEGNNLIITAAGTITTPTLFGGVLQSDGLDRAAYAKAEKYRAVMAGPFEYRLFSGSRTHTLNLGGQFTINGSVHSNGSVSISPSTGTVTGAVEGCNTVYVNQWTATAGSQVPGADYIPMVDFTSVVEGVLPAQYETHVTGADMKKIKTQQVYTGNVYVEGDLSIPNTAVITGNLYVNGNLTINGGAPVVVLNGSVYATGNISFNNTAQINGCVFAGGNINFNGGGLYMTSSNQVCIYSQHGDVYLSTACSQVTGIIYAPEGNVQVVGGNTDFYGSIVGDTLTGIPANLRMFAPTDEFTFLETEEKIRLVG